MDNFIVEADYDQLERIAKLVADVEFEDLTDEWNWPFTHQAFMYGDFVTKVKGSCWTGKVVGWYSTELTPEGYAVESSFEKGSVQIYPASALRKIP
jgi:dihydrofolate reductase (trimethoprim resistance protein)